MIQKWSWSWQNGHWKLLGKQIQKLLNDLWHRKKEWCPLGQCERQEELQGFMRMRNGSGRQDRKTQMEAMFEEFTSNSARYWEPFCYEMNNQHLLLPRLYDFYGARIRNAQEIDQFITNSNSNPNSVNWESWESTGHEPGGRGKFEARSRLTLPKYTRMRRSQPARKTLQQVVPHCLLKLCLNLI